MAEEITDMELYIHKGTNQKNIKFERSYKGTNNFVPSGCKVSDDGKSY